MADEVTDVVARSRELKTAKLENDFMAIVVMRR
jgi:hypothetical protein